MLFGSDFSIPGYLVWGALIYAIFGTALTQWIGSPLVNLDFHQQRFEADFRFNLVRVRENSEQIALLQGEHAERERLSERFGRVVDNWYGIMSRTKRLTAFTASYSQAAVIFPYHPGRAGLFRRQDPARRADCRPPKPSAACRRRCRSSSSIYRTLAEWRAVVARLDGFEMSIASADDAARPMPIRSASCQPAAATDRPAAAPGAAAQRHAAGRGRRLQPARRRAHAGHRPVRRRQVDAVPRHRRHLAVRQRLDRDPGRAPR